MHRYLNKEDGLEELAVGGDGHQGSRSGGSRTNGRSGGRQESGTGSSGRQAHRGLIGLKRNHGMKEDANKNNA